jgi:hypothetical protein
MNEREQLIAELDQAYGEFTGELEGLDERGFDTKWLDNKWGVREIAAHLTGWLGQLGGGFERMSRGERPTADGNDLSDIDGMNAAFAEKARGKRSEEVRFELEQALKSFKTSAGKLPDERFGEGKTANKMFDAAGAPHFREHAEMIRNWRDSLVEAR